MKIALVSDIHANIVALEEVWRDIDKQRIDRIVCLGDIVGYGPDPNPCVADIESRCEITIMGNHDEAALGRIDTGYFNEYARMATDWTANQLTDQAKEFLAGLPLSEAYGPLRLVHASPLDPDAWTYILTLHEADAQFTAFEEQFCFIGHSHMPLILEEAEQGTKIFSFEDNENVVLSGDKRYIINVGSVGQPRDRDPRASYALFDTDTLTVCVRRLPYDVGEVQRRIMDAGLPSFLASRLAHGM